MTMPSLILNSGPGTPEPIAAIPIVEKLK